MNNKTTLALASAALLTFGLGGCASTGMDTGADAPDAAADTSISGSAGSSMASGTADTGGTVAGSTAGSTGGTAAGTTGSASMAGTAARTPYGTATDGTAVSGSTAGTAAAGTATTGSVASGDSGGRHMHGDASGSMHAGAQLPKASTAAEALTLVALVDQHELKLAQLTQSKQVSGPVMEYAKTMVNDHTPHLAKTRSMLDGAGGMKQDSAGARELMKIDQEAMARLNGLQGDAYARAYMEHMVHSHQMGIAMVDASMSVATDASHREFLKTTKQTMQKHLEHAQKVHSQLKG